MFTERERAFTLNSMDVGDVACTSGRSEGRVLRVGCALLPKKVSRYLTSSMISVAHSKGLELVLLDHTKPLLDQGEYDAIVHKLRPNKEWERNLQEYIDARPGVKVIDSLAGIRIVHNRATMLLPLRERPEGITFQRPAGFGADGSGFHCARIQSPTQVDIVEGTSLAEAEELLQRAGLRPPLLVKPLWTDGREGSHGLAVLHDMAALERVLQGNVAASLKPPLVVQQFVEHGGVLFKVYVLGSRTVVCRRPSLGDSYLSQEARRAGVLSLPRISCKSCYAKGSPEDRLSAGMLYKTVVGGGHVHTRGGGRGARAGAGADGAVPVDVPDGAGASDLPHMAHVGSWPEGCGGGGGLLDPPLPAPSPLQRTRPHSFPHLRLRTELYPQPAQAGGGQAGQGQFPAVPPDWVTSALAGTLRDKLGLQLFNFDMICPEGQPGEPWERLYYVVDINYFPGVDKIPDFEHIFVDFLTATCCGGDGNNNDDDDGGGDSEPEHSDGCAKRPSSDAGEPELACCVTQASSEVVEREVRRVTHGSSEAGDEPAADMDLAVGGDGGAREPKPPCVTHGSSEAGEDGPGVGDLDMAGGEDGISSVSSDKVERLMAADAPAPAAEAEGMSEAYEAQAMDLTS